MEITVSQHNAENNEINFIKTLEIEDVLLLESNHKIFNLYLKNKYQNLSILLEKDDENSKILVDKNFIIFELAASLSISNSNDSSVNEGEDAEDELLLKSFAKFAAIYSFENLNELSEDQIEGFAHTFFRFSAVTHMMSYMRTHFYHLVAASGYPRLHIPLIKSSLDEEAENVASDEINSLKK